MVWKIAHAKEKFSEMISRVREEPQVIYNRDTAVAVVINPEQYEEYNKLRKSISLESLGSAFDKLREICKEESYEITVPERTDRMQSWPL